MSDNKEIDAVYVVQINTDGTFVAHFEQPEEKFEVKRVATAYDVLSISKNLVQEIETAQLTDRIIMGLVSVLQQAQEASNPANAVKDKLKERGINPEATAPTE